MSPSVPDLLQQSLSDRYRIERELGPGGMATVCRFLMLRKNEESSTRLVAVFNWRAQLGSSR